MTQIELMREFIEKMIESTRACEHNAALSAVAPDLHWVMVYAHQVKMCEHILVALKELEKDEAAFIERYLQ